VSLGLQAAKDGLCSHKAARHIALHLLAPGTKRYLPAHAAAMLSPASIAVPVPEKTSAAPAADEAPAVSASASKPAEVDEDEDEEMVHSIYSSSSMNSFIPTSSDPRISAN